MVHKNKKDHMSIDKEIKSRSGSSFVNFRYLFIFFIIIKLCPQNLKDNYIILNIIYKTF